MGQAGGAPTTLLTPSLGQLAVPEAEIENWKVTADLLAEVAGVPAALIMRVHAREIEVLASSRGPANVYHQGERAPLDTGLYCETVMSTRRKLVVPNALKDPAWDRNPDLALGMISYCGLPIAWPNGELFGTICILDTKENTYERRTHELIERFRTVIEASLAHIYASSRARLQQESAERALLERETEFRLMVEEVEDYALTMLDREGRVVRWNAGAECMKGYRPDEIVGQHFSCFYPPEDVQAGRPGQELRAAESEGRFEDEGWRVRKDGSRFVASVMITALRDASGQLRGFGTITRDITRRKLAEGEARARAAALAEAHAELKALSYATSHELRAPLRAIDGHVAMIVRDHAPQLDAEMLRHFEKVRENAQRMGLLIDGLLTLLRAGSTDLATGTVDMTRAAKGAFSRAASGPGASSPIALSLDPLPDAHGDPDLLGLVWESLLSNAVKFSRTQRAPEIHVAGSVQGNEAVYRVRDNGVGFDTRYAEKLFGVFNRLHGQDEFEGTGVGLALVKRIVTRHGGRVWAEGEPGNGATFSFSLPVRARPMDPAG